MSDEKQEKMGALSFMMMCIRYILGNTLSSLVVFAFYFSIGCAWIVATSYLGGGR